MQTPLSAGLLYTLLTGILWTGVGVCFAAAARRGIGFSGFMLFYSLIITAFSWLALPDYSRIHAVSRADWQILCATMLPYGILGMLGFGAVRAAMRSGSHSIAWALAQSALAIPFLFAVFGFGEAQPLIAWLGCAAILLGVSCLCFAQKPRSHNYKSGSVAVALLAFVLIGTSQVFAMLPQRLGLSDAADTLRIPVMAAAGIFWLPVFLLGKSTLSKTMLAYCAGYAALVLAGQFTLFKALDAMAAGSRSALVYPLAIGTSIIAFFLYNRLVLREERNPRVSAGVIVITVGILLMACQ